MRLVALVILCAGILISEVPSAKAFKVGEMYKASYYCVDEKSAFHVGDVELLLGHREAQELIKWHLRGACFMLSEELRQPFFLTKKGRVFGDIKTRYGFIWGLSPQPDGDPLFYIGIPEQETSN